MTTTVITIIEGSAIIAFGLTGIFEARRKGLDLIGAFSVCLVTAFGGGTIRDLILDCRPFFWMERYEYFGILFAFSIIGTILLKSGSEPSAWVQKVVGVLDALGLGLFTVTGTMAGIKAGCTPFVSALMGVITCVTGGMLRDILCNEIPVVFKPVQLYATCAFFGALAYIVLNQLGVPSNITVISGAGAATLFRLAAMIFNLQLPGFLK
jgi:uncharacterized membrane protein YeiH